MPPFTLLIPGSLNGEPGLFAALPGVFGSRSWQDWLGGPGGPGGLSAQAGPARPSPNASTVDATTHHDPLHPVTRPAAGLDHCRRQATPTIVWQRCPQRQNDPTIRRHSRLDPPPSDPSSGGSSLPILRLRGVCGVGKTVGRGPVRGGGAGHGADQTSVPTRTPRRNPGRRGVSRVALGYG